jgi:hypothetical protein
MTGGLGLSMLSSMASGGDPGFGDVERAVVEARPFDDRGRGTLLPRACRTLDDRIDLVAIAVAHEHVPVAEPERARAANPLTDLDLEAAGSFSIGVGSFSAAAGTAAQDA